MRMKVTITVTIPEGRAVTTYANVTESLDAANAIREALDEARKQNPGRSIFNSNIKMEPAGNA